MYINNENIAALIVELDKLLPLVPAGSKFTSEWLENEYAGVTMMKDQGKPSYRNEYRIMKTLIEARTIVLLKNKDKLKLFVPSFNIVKAIEKDISEEFELRKNAKSVNADLEALASLMNQ